MKFKVLMIDLDGVIRRWDGQDNQTEPAYGLPKGAIRQIAFASDLLSLAVTGRITDEEWRRRITERLQQEFSSARAAEAVIEWSRPAGEVDWETVSILRNCDPSVKRGLITNATTRLDRDLAELGILNEFVLVINSSAVGFAKPSRKIYEIALQHADAKPSEALFIDDTDRHVRATEELGITGHVFSTHENLRDFLMQARVLLSSSAF